MFYATPVLDIPVAAQMTVRSRWQLDEGVAVSLSR